MSSLLKDVNDQAGDISNMDLHNQLADVLDRNREVSIQEGIYRTLSLPMTKSTVKIKFLSTVHPHLRDGLLKGGIKKLKDGEIIFHLSPHQYYQNRPVECIKEYTMTYNNKKKTIGMNYLSQNSGGLLILFFAFRDECNEIHQMNVNDLYLDNKLSIQARRNIFEKLKVISFHYTKIQIKKVDNVDHAEDNAESDDYLEEESTSTEDLDKFEKWIKAQVHKTFKQNKELRTIFFI